jgi:hypothetical protein
MEQNPDDSGNLDGCQCATNNFMGDGGRENCLPVVRLCNAHR